MFLSFVSLLNLFLNLDLIIVELYVMILVLDIERLVISTVIVL